MVFNMIYVKIKKSNIVTSLVFYVNYSLVIIVYLIF